jgi:hypothetical protein
MLWHTKEELEAEGRPRRNELIWALLALPLLLTQLTVWITRIWRSLGGDPIEILVFQAKITGPLLPFVGVLMIYAIAIIIVILLLWVCCLQGQRWLYWRRR